MIELVVVLVLEQFWEIEDEDDDENEDEIKCRILGQTLLRLAEMSNSVWRGGARRSRRCNGKCLTRAGHFPAPAGSRVKRPKGRAPLLNYASLNN